MLWMARAIFPLPKPHLQVLIISLSVCPPVGYLKNSVWIRSRYRVLCSFKGPISPWVMCLILRIILNTLHPRILIPPHLTTENNFNPHILTPLWFSFSIYTHFVTTSFFFISDFLRRCVSAMYISSLFWTTLVWLRWTKAYTLRPALSRREYNIEIIHDNTASTPRPTLHLSSQDDVGHCLKKSLTPRLWKEMKMDEHLRLFPKGYNLSLTVSFKALTKLHTSETDGKARLPCAGLCRCGWRHQLSVRYWSPMQPFSGEQSDISWSQKVVIAEQLTLSHSDRSVRV